MMDLEEKEVCPVCCLELVSQSEPCCASCQTPTNERLRCPRCHNIIEDPNTPGCSSCRLASPETGWLRLPCSFEGTYELLAEIDRESTGVIYLAAREFVINDETSRERVELKICTSFEEREQFGDAYQEEFFKLGRFGHQPDIIQVFGVERTRHKVPYVVTELTGGPTLRRLVEEEEGPFDGASAAWLGAKIAAALHKVHEQRFLHLDLRPSNIFVLDWGSHRETIKLSGFGATLEVVEGEETVPRQSSSFGGTSSPHFLSPEHAALLQDAPPTGSDTLDRRGDVYCLGLILHYMLTAGSPFEPLPKSDVEWHEAHRDASPADLKRRRGELPQSLQDVVFRCLQKRRSDRFATAGDVAAALRAVLLSEILPEARTTIEKLERRRPRESQQPPGPSARAVEEWKGRAELSEARVDKLESRLRKAERELNSLRNDTDEALSAHAAELAEAERRWQLELSARHRAEARVAAEQARAEQPPGPVVLRLSQKLLSRVTARFVRVLPGTFMMGSPHFEAGRLETRAESSSTPLHTDFTRTNFEQQHEVTLSRPFLLAATPVTQAQFEAVMGFNPSDFKGPKLPVESVSWYDAVTYCNRLSEQQGMPESDWAYALHEVKGKPGEPKFEAYVEWRGLESPGFRLPTEAEWEYACRADTTTATFLGDLDRNSLKDEQPNVTLDPMAWFGGNSGNATNKVATKQPNNWGLHDMLGNVWEWVWDWDDMYPSAPVLDPTGPPTGDNRLIRGGSWSLYARFCRAAYRGRDWPGHRFNDIGFRMAQTII